MTDPSAPWPKERGNVNDDVVVWLRQVHEDAEDDARDRWGRDLHRSECQGHQNPTQPCDCDGPASVLARVEAERAILEWDDRWAEDDSLVMLLASGWRHQPGWREEWAL